MVVWYRLLPRWIALIDIMLRWEAYWSSLQYHALISRGFGLIMYIRSIFIRMLLYAECRSKHYSKTNLNPGVWCRPRINWYYPFIQSSYYSLLRNRQSPILNLNALVRKSYLDDISSRNISFHWVPVIELKWHKLTAALRDKKFVIGYTCMLIKYEMWKTWILHIQ